MKNSSKFLFCFLLAGLALALPALAQAPPEVVVVPSPPDYSNPVTQDVAQTFQTAAPQADVVLPQGTQVAIRFNRNLRLESPGSAFQAALSEDLMVGGDLMAPRGTLVRGELIRSYNAQGQPTPALALTEIWLKNDWRFLQTDPLPLEARGGSGRWRKFLAGLALGGVIAGESLSNRGSDRRNSCPRRSPSGTRAAIGSAAGLGGQLGALLLNRGSGLPQQKVKLKRGQQFRFQLLEAVAFDQR